MNLKKKLSVNSKKSLGLNNDLAKKNSFVSISTLKTKYKQQMEFLNSLENLDSVL